MQPQQATFYWHDYETWGLDPRLDRPSQFAGIRTDLDFNIIGDPDMFYCRLSDDYFPGIESALITGITPEIVQAEGISEVKFAARINQQFIQPNTCVVGYNTLRFDEEFSRNLFYRNFFDAYEYAWKNNNSRWDIIDLVRATYALRPDGIIWPKNEQGLPSFRLELLTAANGINHEQAHDAMSDVYATIAMAKLLKQKSPRIFNYYFELRDKNKVKALIDTESLTPLVHVSGMFGSAKSNLSLIAPLAWHPINSNAVIVADLAQDVSPLIELTADEIRERLYTKHEQLDGQLPIPLKLIHSNKCPFLAVEKTLLAVDAERLGISREYCLHSLKQLKQNPSVIKKVDEVFQQSTTFDHQGNVEAMLYDGFFSFEDKKIFEKIRNSRPDKLAGLIRSAKDSRFKDLFFRYRARNFAETLTEQERQLWDGYRQSVFNAKKSDYFSSLDEISKQQQDNQKNSDIISSLYRYAKTIIADVS